MPINIWQTPNGWRGLVPAELYELYVTMARLEFHTKSLWSMSFIVELLFKMQLKSNADSEMNRIMDTIFR